MRGDLARKVAARGLSAALAGAAFLTLALTPATAWGAVLAVAAVVAALAERRVRPAADPVAEQILLAAGVLVAYAGRRTSGVDWPVVLAGAALIGLILLERPLRDAAALEIRSAHLDVRPSPAQVAERLDTVVPVLVAVLAVAAAVHLPSWLALLAVLLVAVAGAIAAASIARHRFRPSSGAGPVARALRRRQPEFVLHFSAPPGSAYQMVMWLPYLERLGRPFFVLLREPEHLAAVTAATRMPVVVCPTVRAVDEVMVPSLRVAFYVNHGMKNSHSLRHSRLTHIQLHHGDSDKAPSSNPVSGIFDRIFVAGQAAIDRYARNGVTIPAEKFVIVGRPQVESVTPARGRIGDLTDRAVLYTPTWTGHGADEDYCSLPVGEALVSVLLDRGATVIMRTHPYTAQNPASARQAARIEALLARDRAATGRAHVWGQQAARELTLVECFNRSDALVSDVSGVVSDYLYSGKPFAVTDMVGAGGDFDERFPLAAAAYVIRADLSNLGGVLDGLLGADPLEPARRRARGYYLGEFPAEGYGEVFAEAARRFLSAGAGPARHGADPGSRPPAGGRPVPDHPVTDHPRTGTVPGQPVADRPAAGHPVSDRP